jgi:peptide/nickel transport system substrate-binding protein
VLIACGPQSATPQTEENTPVVQNTEAVTTEATATATSSSLTLVAVKDGQAAPGLAVSWTVSEDALDYVFQLRTDATFSDGTPVNADAVVANFNRWFDTTNPAHGSGTYDAWLAAFGGFKGEKDDQGLPKSSFDGIEKVDNFTVLIHLNKPYADLLTTLAKADFAIENPASFTAK